MASLLRTFILVGGLLGFIFVAPAQAVVDNVFGLRPSTSASQRVVGLGDDKRRVIQVLGPPTKTSREPDEINGGWATTLHYGPNQLTFVQDRLGIVELYDARFTVGKPSTAGFHVGSVLPQTKPIAAKPALAFGNFNVAHKPGRSRNINYSASSSGNMKTAQGQGLDIIYEILYDHQGRVTSIFLDQTYD